MTKANIDESTAADGSAHRLRDDVATWLAVGAVMFGVGMTASAIGRGAGGTGLLQAAVGWVSIGAAVWAISILYRTLDATRETLREARTATAVAEKAATVTRDIGQAQVRAYLTFDEKVTSWKEERSAQRRTVAVTIVNSGNSPARILSVELRIELSTYTWKPPQRPSPSASMTSSNMTRGPTNRMQTGYSVVAFASAANTVSSQTDRKIVLYERPVFVCTPSFAEHKALGKVSPQNPVLPPHTGRAAFRLVYLDVFGRCWVRLVTAYLHRGDGESIVPYHLDATPPPQTEPFSFVLKYQTEKLGPENGVFPIPRIFVPGTDNYYNGEWTDIPVEPRDPRFTLGPELDAIADEVATAFSEAEADRSAAGTRE